MAAQLAPFLYRYRYVLALAVLGVMLMLAPHLACSEGDPLRNFPALP